MLTVGITPRTQAKANRRENLLRAAADLFATRGFARVSLDELGSAVGISGPAVYRHFAGKQAVLAALLVDASHALLQGGQRVVSTAEDARAALDELVSFHVDFALANAAVIRVQDRDLDSLASVDSRHVRSLQRQYVELWVDVLAAVNPHEPASVLRTRAHAVFGLINSTPHSGDDRENHRLLSAMATSALTAAVTEPVTGSFHTPTSPQD